MIGVLTATPVDLSFGIVLRTVGAPSTVIAPDPPFVCLPAVPVIPPKIERAKPISACITSSVTRPRVKLIAAIEYLPVVPP